MNAVWKWLAGGAGAAILFAAASWLVAQEVNEQMEPVKMEMRATSQIISDMQFEERYNEAQAVLAELREQGYSEGYCTAQDEWRWDVYYPYLDCIAGLKYKEREDVCGPVPVFRWTEGMPDG